MLPRPTGTRIAGESSSQPLPNISYHKEIILAVATTALAALGAYLIIYNPFHIASLSWRIGTSVAIITGVDSIITGLYFLSKRPEEIERQKFFSDPFKSQDYQKIEQLFASAIYRDYDILVVEEKSYLIRDLVIKNHNDSKWLGAMWQGMLQHRSERAITYLLGDLFYKKDRDFSFDSVRDSLLALLRQNPGKMMLILQTLIPMHGLHFVSDSLSNEEKENVLLYISTAKELDEKVSKNPQLGEIYLKAKKAAIEEILDTYYYQDFNVLINNEFRPKSGRTNPSIDSILKFLDALEIQLTILAQKISETSSAFKAEIIFSLVGSFDTLFDRIYEHFSSDKISYSSKETSALIQKTMGLIEKVFQPTTLQNDFLAIHQRGDRDLNFYTPIKLLLLLSLVKRDDGIYTKALREIGNPTRLKVIIPMLTPSQRFDFLKIWKEKISEVYRPNIDSILSGKLYAIFISLSENERREHFPNISVKKERWKIEWQYIEDRISN